MKGTFLYLLRELVARTGWDQAEIARQFEVSQPTVSRWMNGSEPKASAVIQLDKLMAETGGGRTEKAPAMSKLRIVGRIGAGAQIDVSVEQFPAGGEEIETVLPLPAGAIGFEVVGDSMWPRYDPGDVIVCTEQGIPLPELQEGEEAAVKTTDGLRYLKRVLRTEPRGFFNLESHNASPIRGVQLDWASEVVAVIRALKWRRSSDAQKRRLVKKAMAS